MFWLFIILLLLTLALWFVRVGASAKYKADVARGARDPISPVGFTVAASVATALAVLALIFSVFFSVGTKEVGIPTSFGAVSTSHYGAGPHLKLPWVKIHTMDGAIQTVNDLKSNCLSVRIANNQTGCAEVSLQWRINPNQVDYLYKNYRSFDHVRDQLVERKLFNAVNESLADYNPLAHISAKGNANPLPYYQTLVYRTMQQKVKDINGQKLVEILNVQLPLVHFDGETQSRINQLQQQVAQTAIAKQRKKTNAAESEANAALSKNNTLTPLVLESRCLDEVDAMIKADQPVPAGLNCGLGGSSLAGIIANTPTPAAK